MQEHDATTATSGVPALKQEHLDAILQYDTCTIANAIECFGVRLRNEGFTQPGINSITGEDHRILGHAVTCRMKTSEPPVTGGAFSDRTDWWSMMESLPCPKIAVIENIDMDSVGGACIGEVHAAILKALGCSAVVTNGSARDIEGMKKLGFPVFAPTVSVSHSYSHMVDFGTPVNIFGLLVHQGDLLYADRYGVLSIPVAIAAELPKMAELVRRKDRSIIELCMSADFSIATLQQIIQEGGL